jgi:phenylalanyl-tRNA synthetase beta subunit
LRFRAAERTLTDREIDPLMAAIVRQLERTLNVQLREN